MANIWEGFGGKRRRGVLMELCYNLKTKKYFKQTSVTGCKL